MELPASLREINPAVDRTARGEQPGDGAALRLAIALGLMTPEGSLTAAGRAYARPALPEGPLSLVMSPERRAAADSQVAGPLPLQATLRRLLRQIASLDEPLVDPLSLGWPEVLVRPYVTYLEDLGLLVPIGPMVEVTPRGRELAFSGSGALGIIGGASGVCPSVPAVPTFGWAPFRYHLIRRVCMDLISMRGRREWHRLQPLLDGPLSVLKPAYNEWFLRFQGAQPAARRTWGSDLVAHFEARIAYPAWFEPWCQALLSGSDVVDGLASAALVLQSPAVLSGAFGWHVWLMATALEWASRRGHGVVWEAAASRFALDGIRLPAWSELLVALEGAGLLVGGNGVVRLLLPVEVAAFPGSTWPYGGPEWVVAALLEGGAFALPSHPRRSLRV